MKAKVWICLLVFGMVGCATLPAGPPPDCRESLLWSSGFMPTGREVVELGVAALLTAEPSLKPQVKNLAVKGWRLAKRGTVKDAVAELLALLESYPRYAPLALFALQRLDLERSLAPSDQEVLLGMFRNIALYAGAREQDFESGQAELAAPRP